MKALILANLGKGHFHDNEYLPSCYLPTYNEMTVLERQISLLNLNGIKNKDICILFGSGGIWDIESVKERTQNIKTKKLYLEKYNVLCPELFAMDFFNDEDVLILDGNLVFDIAILSRLRRYKEKNVLVVNHLIQPDEAEHVIELAGNRIIKVSSSELMAYPWITFAGIARLSAAVIHELKDVVKACIPFLDAIDNILGEKEIVAIDYSDLLYGRLNGGHSDELIGGSYSKLNYRLVVKKENDGAGREKLINEITWLLNLPAELKPYFSEVLEYDTESQKVFFDVPYYGSRNLREYIFDGHFDSNATIAFLEKLLDWMFDNVYSRKMGSAPDSWIIDKHINRVLDRLVECSDKSEVLKKLISAQRIKINGIEYKNIRELYEELTEKPDLLKILQPKELVMIHGDLHFQNILVYSGNDTGFMLVDPRGELQGSDIYYDMGKLWHSFHGKYDFIHSDQFELNMFWDDDMPVAEFEFTNKYSVKVYDEIYDKFLKLITKYDKIGKDPYWEMKALFAEASHFCSVSTFHVGKTETAERVAVLYLTGVVLINEFYQKYICGDKWKSNEKCE